MNDMRGFINISYPVERDSWDGASSEGIWVKLVKPLPPFRAIVEVHSIPFSTRTLSFGDKMSVEYKESERQVVFEAIVERGGHSTCQIFVKNKNSNASDMLDGMMAMGCGWEGGDHGGGKIYALDIPPEVDINDIFEILDRGQKEGHWHFQEGYIAHPPRSTEGMALS